MVLTTRSEKTPPAGIPTCTHAQAEQEEHCQHCQQQESVAAVGATQEQAQQMLPPLLTQPPPPSTQLHRSSESAIVAAIDYAPTPCTLNFADAEVEEQQWVRRDVAPGEKTTGEMEDVEPEEKDDDRLTITRLDVKSKSNISDAELCQYFNSKLQKTEASNCGNCNCNCFAILTDGQVRLAVSRYLSWFWRQPSKYDCDIIVFEWYKYSPFLKSSRQGRTRLKMYRLPYIDNGTEPVPEMIRNHFVCTKGLQIVLGYGCRSFRRMSREARYVFTHLTSSQGNR
jgi:hypothetical protein